MKYKFSWIVIAIDWLVDLLFCVVLTYARVVLSSTEESAINGFFISFVIYIALLPMLIKHSKRHLFLYKDFIQFKSFHVDKEYRDIDVDYKSIQKISKKFYPNLKGFCLSIKTTKCKHNILIDATINNSRELFSEICKRAKLANSNVEISEKLLEYLSKGSEQDEK